MASAILWQLVKKNAATAASKTFFMDDSGFLLK
jgi:hypothetical protein